MTYNVFSGTLNPTHFTSLLGGKIAVFNNFYALNNFSFSELFISETNITVNKLTYLPYII